MTFKTDLNHRERAEFHRLGHEIGDAFKSMADALKKEDDDEALANLIAINLSAPSYINRLQEVYKDCMERIRKPDGNAGI